MNRKLLLTLLTMAAVSGLPLRAQTHDAVASLQRHVRTLASDEMLGRRAGSGEAASAASYIIRNFEEIGLYPAALGDGGERSFVQNFERGSGKYANVLGFLPGNDPDLREEYIVLGAHYDHLGYTVNRGDTTIYHGADDNASGVAVLIEAARLLKARESELKRSVIFAAFDAEEAGLYGSWAMVENIALDNVKFMASIDMVGWLRQAGKLEIKGTGDLRNGKDILESISRPEKLTIETVKSGQRLLMGSDHDSFHRAGIPALLITTGTLSPYHTPEDSAEKIDYEGMDMIAGYIADLTVELATRGEIEPGMTKSRMRSGIRPVEFALTASIGSSGLNFYPRGAVQGMPRFSWNAGVFMQYNFNAEVALRTEVNYAHRTFRYPRANQAGELLVTGGYRKLVSPALTVPVTLLLKTTYMDDYYVFVGAGLYYSHIFNARLDGEDMAHYGSQGGFTLTVGWNLRHVGIAYMGYLPFMYMSPSSPRTWGYSNYLTLYYKF